MLIATRQLGIREDEALLAWVANPQKSVRNWNSNPDLWISSSCHGAYGGPDLGVLVADCVVGYCGPGETVPLRSSRSADGRVFSPIQEQSVNAYSVYSAYSVKSRYGRSLVYLGCVAANPNPEAEVRFILGFLSSPPDRRGDTPDYCIVDFCFTSRDGILFTRQTMPTGNYPIIKCLNGIWVAPKYAWAIDQLERYRVSYPTRDYFISTDGKKWEQKSAPTQQGIEDIEYFKGFYFIINTHQANNYLFKSQDLTNWTPVETGIPNNTYEYNIIAVTKDFMAIIANRNSRSSLLLTADGVRFEEIPHPPTREVYELYTPSKMISVNNQFLMAGGGWGGTSTLFTPETRQWRNVSNQRGGYNSLFAMPGRAIGVGYNTGYSPETASLEVG